MWWQQQFFIKVIHPFQVLPSYFFLMIIRHAYDCREECKECTPFISFYNLTMKFLRFVNYVCLTSCRSLKTLISSGFCVITSRLEITLECSNTSMSHEIMRVKQSWEIAVSINGVDVSICNCSTCFPKIDVRRIYHQILLINSLQSSQSLFFL